MVGGLGVGVGVARRKGLPCLSLVCSQAHVQNAALAGGVVVGTSAEMMLTLFGALAAGFLAGAISTLGYKFFTVHKPLGP